MGWTLIEHRPAGESHEEFFARELLGEGQEILASAHLGGIGGTFYAAVREKRSGEVWALIVLTTGRAGSRFGWKEIDESQGAAAYECPAHILDLLSPAADERALEWRRGCRARLRRLAAVIPGARIRFEFDYLTPEGPCRSFEAVDPAQDHFRGPGRTVYRLTGWRREGFEVLAAVASGSWAASPLRSSSRRSTPRRPRGSWATR